MVRLDNVRGLVRENLNSDFMRLKNYEVIDNPKLKPSDGVSSLKRPDHRIDGTIFDSYAPAHSIKSWDWFYVDAESEFDLWERCRSDFSPEMLKDWQRIQKKLIQKRITEKVSAGQTRNILLNLSDASDTGQVLCDKEFADILNQVKNLESVVCIYPKEMTEYRGYSHGKGESWRNYIPSDMEAVQWLKGMSGFRPLPDGKGRRSDEDDKSDNEPEADDKPDRDNKPEVEGPGNSTNTPNPGGSTSWILSALSALNIFSLVGMFSGIFAWLSGLFGSSKKKGKRDSKSKKSAGVIYWRYMWPIVNSTGNQTPDFAVSHEHVKAVVIRLLPPGPKDPTEIEEVLDCEYDDLTVDYQVFSFLHVLQSNPFYETIVLFIRCVSRFVSAFITIATKEINDSPRVIGMHAALVVTSLLGQRLLQLVYLGMFAGPLKSFYYICIVSFTIWLVHALVGFGAYVSSAISHVSNILWENTERKNISSRKFILPRRAAAVLVCIVLFILLGRSFKSLSLFSTVLKAPALLFTPFISLVRAFKYFEFLFKLAQVFSALLAILLVALMVQMVRPVGAITHYLEKKIMGYTVNSVADGFWNEMEAFINLKPAKKSA